MRAQAALERLLARMSPQVSRERVLLPECLSARAAFKGPLSRVNAPVNLEIICTGEGLAAFHAPVLGGASWKLALSVVALVQRVHVITWARQGLTCAVAREGGCGTSSADGWIRGGESASCSGPA